MTLNQYKLLLWELMARHYNATTHHRLIFAEDVRAQYDVVSAEAQADFPDAACSHVNPWKWQQFKEQYKAATGLEPIGDWTVVEIDKWNEHTPI